MELLLHTCCAPCLIYPLEVLRKAGFKVTGFFYNPNIHPFAEYLRRKEALAVLNPGIELIYPEYSPREFFQLVNLNEEAPQRCSLCWRERLKKTAQSARAAGFKYFTTTLLVSPYQDHEVLRKIAADIADKTDIKFHYEDYRRGFKGSIEKAKLKGIYLQNYCGCIFSKEERSEKRAGRIKDKEKKT